jgi:phenylacetate-CoA ligase
MAGVQMVAARIQTEPPYWVWNAAQRQLYVSVYHLGPLQARATLRAISRARCRYLWGYPSALDALARAALEEPASRPSLAVVISNAEPLLAQQRLRIERAFGCAVRDTYGLVELVAGGGECEAGRLHLFPEFGWVETLDERGGPVLGAPGEIVATSLLDQDMPLVRYRTGDRGVGGRSSSTCSCGRGLEVLAALEGRQDDVVYSIDGRPVARLDPVFKDQLAVREAQVIQEADGEVCVRLVAADGFGQADERMIARELQDRLGALPVRFELVDRIARGPNGKFRGVISRRRPTQTVAQAATGH